MTMYIYCLGNEYESYELLYTAIYGTAKTIKKILTD